MTTTNPEFPSGSNRVSTHGDSLAERLRATFRESPYQELRRLECDFCEGTLTVRGQLSSFYLKQLAVCLAQQTEESVPIEIAIDVN